MKKVEEGGNDDEEEEGGSLYIMGESGFPFNFDPSGNRCIKTESSLLYPKLSLFSVSLLHTSHQISELPPPPPKLSMVVGPLGV